MPERRTFLKALGAGALGAAATGFSTPPARASSASTNASDPSPPDSPRRTGCG
ncbi:twin-arginine translocation signal domain-containing protein [Salinibacter ruber]|uniref:twin-arginine translocation signal domain-containing protein n=1 Tax=Salinibacter ruber TaxID=146919 RepID=UPI00216A0178